MLIDNQRNLYCVLTALFTFMKVFYTLLKLGPLGALVHSPDPLLQSTMCEYVMEKVFREAEEDVEPTTDEEAYAYAEKLSDRRVLLAGFLKLLMYSIFEANVGVPVFGQYVKVHKYYSVY